MQDPKPRPKQWTKQECYDWLRRHKSSDADITYVSTAIIHYVDHYKSNKNKTNPSLTSKELSLFRLYEEFFHDDFKCVFYNRNDSMNRTQLDAKKSDKLPPTYWELVSMKYNTSEWVPDSTRFDGWGGFLKRTVFFTSH